MFTPYLWHGEHHRVGEVVLTHRKVSTYIKEKRIRKESWPVKLNIKKKEVYCESYYEMCLKCKLFTKINCPCKKKQIQIRGFPSRRHPHTLVPHVRAHLSVRVCTRTHTGTHTFFLWQQQWQQHPLLTGFVYTHF